MRSLVPRNRGVSGSGGDPVAFRMPRISHTVPPRIPSRSRNSQETSGPKRLENRRVAPEGEAVRQVVQAVDVGRVRFLEVVAVGRLAEEQPRRREGLPNLRQERRAFVRQQVFERCREDHEVEGTEVGREAVTPLGECRSVTLSAR